MTNSPLLVGPTGVVFVHCVDGSVYGLLHRASNKWHFETNGSVQSGGVFSLDGKTIYVGTLWNNGALYAIHSHSGKLKWKLSTQMSVCNPKVGANGMVYIGVNGSLHALDPNGKEQWQFKFSDEYEVEDDYSPLLGPDGMVYENSEREGNALYALHGGNGTVKWTLSPGSGPFRSIGRDVAGIQLSFGDDGTTYAGASDSYSRGSSYAFGAYGNIKWHVALNSSGAPHVLSGQDGVVYVAYYHGILLCLNGSDGSQIWNLTTGPRYYSAPVVGPDGTLYVSSSGDGVYAVDARSGTVKWKVECKDPTNVAVGPAGDVFFGHGCDGCTPPPARQYNLLAVNGSDGRTVWSIGTRYKLAAPPTIGPDGTVYAIDTYGELTVAWRSRAVLPATRVATELIV